jgi:hypothetical protein
LEARPFFFLNFNGTQEEHKTIFSRLKINEMTLSDQIDFPAFFCLPKMTLPEFHQFQNTTIRYRLCFVRWLHAVKFEKIDFPELADC